MGSPPLKAKRELDYRSGTTSKSWRYCNHFMWASEAPTLFGHETESRCTILGTPPDRAYRITPNSLCDKYGGNEHQKRLKAGTSLAVNDFQI